MLTATRSPVATVVRGRWEIPAGRGGYNGPGQMRRSSFSSIGAGGKFHSPMHERGGTVWSDVAEQRNKFKSPPALHADGLYSESWEERDLHATNMLEDLSGKATSIVEDVSAGIGELAENMKNELKNSRRQKFLRRKSEQKWYMLAAIASTIGFLTLSAAAVIFRFVSQMPATGRIPYGEILGTFLLAGGAAVGMEYWARWAHRALWHESLWNMHESHHLPRDGPFEANDVFAIINAIPAIALMLYGFLNKGLVPGLCFGAGLGITMFGISYMFVHDGLVHRRFPVGPIADVPYLKKVAAAHQLHHADLFKGVPFGLFLGPKELEKVGGEAELEKVLRKGTKVGANRK